MIANIQFNNSKPTIVNQKRLHNWVVWQYPKKIAAGMCGAVHPPSENFGWLPAVIYPDKKEVQIHGHVTESFATPKLAAEYCLANGRS
ncbi:MAG: hypothetical protein GY805_12105 [Chloroflexi bacterium]|nr:hypothetical protein [Chloroflexota bacterium]